MGWYWLIGSIAREVIGTTFLKLASSGGKHALPCSVAVVLFYVACFALLAGAMKHFSLGTVYAIWSGLGVSLLAAIGVIAFGDPIDPLKVVSLVLIIAGVVGLNLSGLSH